MAYDQCIFLGDQFGLRSFEQYFKNRKSIDYNGYVKANFDTCGFFGSFISENPSLISRLSNVVITAIEHRIANRMMPLPKLFVMVPDNDIIKLFIDKHCEAGVSKPLSRIINQIMTNHDRMVSSYRDSLPARCVKSDFPHFLWIQAPTHTNFTDENNALRIKFNRCLEEAVNFHPNTSSLQLKKVWCYDDRNLFLADAQRYTTEGLKSYWEAVDKTVRYCDTVLLKKQTKRKNQKMMTVTDTSRKDKFRWQNPRLNINTSPQMDFCKLPPPPSQL